MKPDFQL